MRKDSPVEKFPGYVILPDYLTLPQVRTFESALGDLGSLTPNDRGNVLVSVLAEKRLPVILECVSEWHLDNIPTQPTLETFPFSPVVQAGKLVDWLFSEIRNIWIGEVEDPKN